MFLTSLECHITSPMSHSHARRKNPNFIIISMQKTSFDLTCLCSGFVLSLVALCNFTEEDNHSYQAYLAEELILQSVLVSSHTTTFTSEKCKMKREYTCSTSHMINAHKLSQKNHQLFVKKGCARPSV